MKPLATLSLDLDNEWSYLKTHGDAGWESFPSYLDRVVPRALDLLRALDLRVTFMVVGQDAALPKNREALARIPADGHEVGHHSFHHEPWLHLYPPERVEDEIARAEDAISEATSCVPAGFRGPGYSVSATVLEVLARRGYRYDASTFPTFLGPLARAYYFMTTRLDPEKRRERSALFGTVADGLRPLKPYFLRVASGRLLEVPVTTFPVLRAPIHPSYLLYLGRFSRVTARAYFRAALAACRARGVEPSILLHPLDFLGGDEVPSLRFFPAMDRPASAKMEQLRDHLSDLARAFTVLPMGRYADVVGRRPGVPEVEPDFPAAAGGGEGSPGDRP